VCFWYSHSTHNFISYSSEEVRKCVCVCVCVCVCRKVCAASEKNVIPMPLGNLEGHAAMVDCVWNVMAHVQKPDFVFRRNGRVHLNRRWHQFSRLLAAEVCTSAVVMLDTPCSEVVWKVLATHSIRQFPLHFPSRASSCTITFHPYYTECLWDLLAEDWVSGWKSPWLHRCGVEALPDKWMASWRNGNLMIVGN